MQAGKDGPFWRVRHAGLVPFGPGLACCLLIGCAAQSQHLDQALMGERSSATPRDDVVEQYHLGCPDEVEVTLAGRPLLQGRLVIGPDGCLDLGKLGRLRVDGKTTTEAARFIAERAGVPPSTVAVTVQAYRSQQVYLVGEVRGLQRAVPYQGPERIAELLQRVGGLTSGAAVGDVYLVRPHLIDGRAPEVFHVDLQAILMRNDQGTNVVVQPFDQITVGETRQSYLARGLPPILLPFYQSLFGLQQ